MWGMHDGMGWWMIFGSVWVVVFWGAVIWAIVHVLSRGNRQASEELSALDIARRRYAKGEITKEEFEQLRRSLT